MPSRIAKINELIKQQMAEIIVKELDLKSGVFVTVTKVDTTTDLRYTRISLSIFPEHETTYIMKTFDREKYRLQGLLNHRLHLRIFPRIEFKEDTTETQAQKIEEIFKEIRTEKED